MSSRPAYLHMIHKLLLLLPSVSNQKLVSVHRCSAPRNPLWGLACFGRLQLGPRLHPSFLSKGGDFRGQLCRWKAGVRWKENEATRHMMDCLPQSDSFAALELSVIWSPSISLAMDAGRWVWFGRRLYNDWTPQYSPRSLDWKATASKFKKQIDRHEEHTLGSKEMLSLLKCQDYRVRLQLESSAQLIFKKRLRDLAQS